MEKQRYTLPPHNLFMNIPKAHKRLSFLGWKTNNRKAIKYLCSHYRRQDAPDLESIDAGYPPQIN